MERRTIGWWLKHLDEQLERAFERTLAAEGVGRRHWQLMQTVRDEPGDEGALAERLRPFWTEGAITFGETMGRLTEQGWAGRDEDGCYRLTAAGETVHARLAERIHAARSQAVQGISEEEYAAAIDVLRRMSENLEAQT